MHIANRSRKHNIGIRVSDRELELIQSKVTKSGLTLREFFMRCVQNNEFVIKEGGHEVVIELKRLGNNLNQLTYLANAGRINDCTKGL
ncbi:plasmid mobilization protein, partial [Christensenella sp.]|uniref:plasmid mobilization protein n=1 Tax=Christensenella sp. TaxID=1935934 RepID=UPI003FA4CAC2